MASKDDKFAIEYMECAESFAHFLFTVCITQDNKAKMERRFPQWDYIKKIADALQYTEGNIIINKCRQMGLSWILAAYCLWRILYTPNWNIPMISKLGESAFDGTTQSFGGKVVWLWEHLPSHLKQELKVTQVPKKIVNPRNGSGLHMFNASDDSARGGSGAEFIGDEAAFFPHADMILAAVAPSVGRLILNSTFNGDNPDQPYYKNWSDKHNGWTKVAIDYYDHPEHTKDTYEEECRKLNYDKIKIAQELDRNPSLSLAGKMFDFNPDRHIQTLPPQNMAAELLMNCVYSGHDIGYGDGHAYVLSFIKNINGINHLYIYKDYYKTEHTPKQIAQQFKEDYGKYPHMYQQDIADPTAVAKGQDGSPGMFHKFQLEGVNFIKGSNDHNSAIIMLNSMLTEGTIHFSADCKWLVEAICQAHYPTDKTGRVTDYTSWVHDKYSHVLCALSYIILTVYPRIGRKKPAVSGVNKNAYGEAQGNSTEPEIFEIT